VARPWFCVIYLSVYFDARNNHTHIKNLAMGMCETSQYNTHTNGTALSLPSSPIIHYTENMLKSLGCHWLEITRKSCTFYYHIVYFKYLSTTDKYKKYFFNVQSVHIIYNQHVDNTQLLNEFLGQSRKVHCKS